jgi:hypothetical protein
MSPCSLRDLVLLGGVDLVRGAMLGGAVYCAQIGVLTTAPV